MFSNRHFYLNFQSMLPSSILGLRTNVYSMSKILFWALVYKLIIFDLNELHTRATLIQVRNELNCKYKNTLQNDTVEIDHGFNEINYI